MLLAALLSHTALSASQLYNSELTHLQFFSSAWLLAHNPRDRPRHKWHPMHAIVSAGTHMLLLTLPSHVTLSVPQVSNSGRHPFAVLLTALVDAPNTGQTKNGI